MESTAIESDSTKPGELVFSSPDATDGLKVHQLIAACPPLDPNSIYCNLLQCHHFADTSVKVEKDGRLVAFISGYIPPRQPDVLFIWQVAVSAEARGQGVGGRMLQYLVDSPACRNVRYMHTTVTPDNKASTAMFASFASKRNAACSEQVLFDRERHFGGRHDSEVLFTIGPF
jgi:L-2,4-diaminobutyric acid acetyltransferase